MRRMLPLLAISCAVSTLALADSWSGKLLDAACYNQSQKSDGCDATAKTVNFALDVGTAVFKLDHAGDAKAAAALKNRADRTDPNQAQSGRIMAKVDGTQKGTTITVDNIDIQ